MADLKLEVYIYFPGNCREAMEFYKSVFGGELTLQTYGDSPMDMPSPGDNKDKLMHAVLDGGKIKLMGADTEKASSEAAKIDLSLGGSDEEALTTIFTELSAGGEVRQPLEKMFWGDKFGSFTDKFGVHWMMNIEMPKGE